MSKSSNFQYIRSASLVHIGTIICSAILLAQLIRYAGSGFDFTDEGYYLNWISNPWIFSGELTQFGFIYHPVYLAVGGAVSALRQFNIILTFALGWIVTFGALTLVEGSRTGIVARAALAGGLATTSLCFFRLWLPTPNYNSLAFQALLIAAAGMLMSTSGLTERRFLGWQVIAVGVWLAFMSKPTTAAALIPVLAVHAFWISKARLQPVLLGLVSVVGLTVAFAHVAYGGIDAFAISLVEGSRLARITSGTHSIAAALRIDGLALTWPESVFFVSSVALIVWSVGAFARRSADVVQRSSAVALGLIFAGAVMAMMLATPPFPTSAFIGVVILCVPIASLVALLSALTTQGVRGSIKDARWAIPVIFFVLPFAYAFGTSSNYWSSASAAGLFWTVSGVIVLRNLKPSLSTIAPAIAYSQMFGVLVAVIGLNSPYRQPESIVAQTVPVVFASDATLLVAADSARYLNALNSAAVALGFMKGDPLIDLTGDHPGALFALGARPVGRAWIVGGYPGSEEAAALALSKVACGDLGKAWLLIEPGGPRALSPAILARFGLNISDDYRASSFVYPPAASDGRSTGQYLLRPTDALANGANSASEGASDVQSGEGMCGSPKR